MSEDKGNVYVHLLSSAGEGEMPLGPFTFTTAQRVADRLVWSATERGGIVVVTNGKRMRPTAILRRNIVRPH